MCIHADVSQPIRRREPCFDGEEERSCAALTPDGDAATRATASAAAQRQRLRGDFASDDNKEGAATNICGGKEVFFGPSRPLGGMGPPTLRGSRGLDLKRRGDVLVSRRVSSGAWT